MDKLIKIYPFNLAKKIFNDKNEALKLYIPGLEIAMQGLTAKEREFITAKYRDGKTLRELGENNGITLERARQIVERAVRKLRSPERAKMFYGTSYAEMSSLTQENTVLTRQLHNIEEAFNVMSEKLKTNTTPTALKASGIIIEDANLSVRAYNVFRQSGVRTLGEIAAMTTSRTKGLVNMGTRTFNEIASVLHAHGLRFADEDGIAS